MALGKENVACIVHSKSSFGGFPKEDLEEKLRVMPEARSWSWRRP